jgi:hypothetical protein
MPTAAAKKASGGHEQSIERVVPNYVPAFFSCMVKSFQSTFILSLRAIHRSACSCGGKASHLFSISANVGLLIACACLTCWLIAGTVRLAMNWRDGALLTARRTDVRIILEQCVGKREIRGGEGGEFETAEVVWTTQLMRVVGFW